MSGSAVDQIKLGIIVAIAERMLVAYPTQVAASEALGYDRAVISRLLSGEAKRFSVSWLVALAHRLGCKVRIEVE
jgi:predicted XRE-type DNA-binding protein